MSGKNISNGNGLVKKACSIKKMVALIDMELDELIDALNDPTILHKELTGRRKEIEEKLHNVVETMVDLKKLQRK